MPFFSSWANIQVGQGRRTWGFSGQMACNFVEQDHSVTAVVDGMCVPECHISASNNARVAVKGLNNRAYAVVLHVEMKCVDSGPILFDGMEDLKKTVMLGKRTDHPTAPGEGGPDHVSLSVGENQPAGTATVQVDLQMTKPLEEPKGHFALNPGFLGFGIGPIGSK